MSFNMEAYRNTKDLFDAWAANLGGGRRFLKKPRFLWRSRLSGVFLMCFFVFWAFEHGTFLGPLAFLCESLGSF